MTARQRTSLAMLWSILAFSLLSQAAQAAQPSWWADAQADALRDGYVLVDDAGLEALRADGKALIVDVRPDYEFAMGHMPGAVNMEFHLGDEAEPAPERVRLLTELLGPDHGRTLVFYCRSFM